MPLIKRIILLFLFCFSIVSLAKTPRYGIVIHAGAGTIDEKNLTPKLKQEVLHTLNQSLDAGYRVLNQGNSALNAVTASIRVLENSPLFNAGKGAAYTQEANHVLEASVMTGHDAKVGAVIQLQQVKNPILLAAKVLQYSPYVMLAAKDAETFAKKQKLTLVNNHFFDTKARFALFKKWQKAFFKKQKFNDERHFFGTVGAVALDKKGHLAAGTSTGGLTGKLVGRIGDSPLIGAGTFANKTCAVSATGHGEDFIRHHVSGDICASAHYQHITVSKAARQVFNAFNKAKGRGGIIVLGKQGDFYLTYNSKGMYRGVKMANGQHYVAIHQKEYH